MKRIFRQPHRHRASKAGFSLVEILVVLVILGTVLFLAIPNIVQVRSDSEDNLARARAEALNVAAAAYFQAVGRQAATAAWTGAANSDTRYALISPYLAFASTNLAGFMPTGYSVSFSTTDPLRQKAALFRGTNALSY
ncbi:MAG: prepilin-type N-terminal cleavage/methylation domain-containing protein [Chthoniobacterales bacterium]